MFSNFKTPKRNVPVPALPIQDFERSSPSTSPVPRKPMPNHKKAPSVQSHHSVGSVVTDDEYANNNEKKADYIEMVGAEHVNNSSFYVGSVGGWSSGAKYGSKLGDRTVAAKMPVVKEGWVWRKGRLGSYKQCYVVVRQGERTGMVFLFKSNQSTFPFKSINLNDCTNAKLRDSGFINQFGSVGHKSEFKISGRKEDYYLACDQISEAKEWIDLIQNMLPRITEPAYQKVNQELATIYSKCSTLNAQRDELEHENDVLRQNLGKAHSFEREKEEELLRKIAQLRQNESALKSEVQALTVQLQAVIDTNNSLQQEIDQERRNSLAASNNHTLLYEIRCLMDEKLKLPDEHRNREEDLFQKLNQSVTGSKQVLEQKFEAELAQMRKENASLMDKLLESVAGNVNCIKTHVSDMQQQSNSRDASLKAEFRAQKAHFDEKSKDLMEFYSACAKNLETAVSGVATETENTFEKVAEVEGHLKNIENTLSKQTKDISTHLDSQQNSLSKTFAGLETSIGGILPKLSAKTAHDLKANNQVLIKELEHALENLLENRIQDMLAASLQQQHEQNSALVAKAETQVQAKVQEASSVLENKFVSKLQNHVSLLETSLTAKIESIAESIIESVEASDALSKTEASTMISQLSGDNKSLIADLRMHETEQWEFCKTLIKQTASNADQTLSSVVKKAALDASSNCAVQIDESIKSTFSSIEKLLSQFSAEKSDLHLNVSLKAVESQLNNIKDLVEKGFQGAEKRVSVHTFFEPIVKAAAALESNRSSSSIMKIDDDSSGRVDPLKLATRFVTSVQDGLADLQIRLSRMDVDRQRDADLSSTAIQQLYDLMQHVQKTLSDVLYDNEKGGFVSSRSSSPVGSMKRLEQSVESMRAEISKQTDQIVKTVEQKLHFPVESPARAVSLLSATQHSSVSTLIEDAQVSGQDSNNVVTQFFNEIASAKSQLEQLYREKERVAIELEGMKFTLDIAKLKPTMITASSSKTELDDQLDTKDYSFDATSFNDCMTPTLPEEPSSPLAAKAFQQTKLASPARLSF